MRDAADRAPALRFARRRCRAKPPRRLARAPPRRRIAIRQAAPTQAVRARRSTIRLNRLGAPPRIGARLAVARAAPPAATQARL
ncbi:hypothetical protein [Burkholderia pseudomallei]